MTVKALDSKTSLFNLSSKGFLLYSPISIFGFQVSVMVVNEQGLFGQLLFAGFAVTLATFISYLTLIQLFNLNSKYSSSFILQIILLACLGIIRGFLFFAGVEFLGINQPSGLAERLTSSVFNTIFWLGLANYVISVSNKFANSYQKALNQYLIEKVGTTKSSGLSPSNLNLLNSLQSQLADELRKYLDKSDPESFKELSKTISKQINDRIRPISRRIWIKSINEVPAIRYRQLFSDSITFLRFSWPQFYFLLISLSIFGNLALRSPVETFWRTITYVLCLGVLSILFQIVRRKIAKRSLILNSVSLILFGLIPVIFSEYLVNQLGYAGDWIATILVSPVAPVLMLSLSLLNLAQQDRRMILDLLQDDSFSMNRALPGLSEIEGAQVASYLHNSLQSELLALANQLYDAAQESNYRRKSELIEKVAARINRSIADDFLSTKHSPQMRLDSVIEAWKGILEIEITVSDPRIFELEKAPILVQAIEEISTNLARYDSASRVLIEITSTDSTLQVKFQSDGKGQLVGAKGLGSSWFEKIAIRPMTIGKNKLGTHIELEL